MLNKVGKSKELISHIKNNFTDLYICPFQKQKGKACNLNRQSYF